MDSRTSIFNHQSKIKNHQSSLLLQVAISASIAASEKILEVYDSDFTIEQKVDKSPLTLADKKSHETIVSFLHKTNLPVLSEEGKDIPYTERRNWEYFWLVDPLDGTKEFIKRNGEFTVNIALIEKNRPVLGVIYVPVQHVLYYAKKGMGAFKIEVRSWKSEVGSWLSAKDFVNGILKFSKKLPLSEFHTKYTVVASRSHNSPETENYLNELKKQYGEIETISSGSSLKFCLVAEGKADEYPRFGPTMEWDTAAGHAIVEATGKKVTDVNRKNDLIYNKENLLNPFFIVST